MRKIITLSVMALFALHANSQIIFLEDFDGIDGPTAGGAGTYNFPVGWTLANVDNRTPASSVSYVNQAWERREDFQANVADSCAFSTSWYQPGGSADDWMWTPAIHLISGPLKLSWNAKAYDAAYKDGYEVRIMTTPPTGGTGVLGNMVSSSTLLYSNTATGENSSWTSREIDISAFAGQTVYIGFRNNSDDKFLLVIDDIKVERVVNLDARLYNYKGPEYTLLPLSQSANQSFIASILNMGISPITNVRLRANIYKGSSLVSSLTSAVVPSLISGAYSELTVAWNPTDTGVYSIKLFPTINETDQDNANDTFGVTRIITDSVYARDNGEVTGTLGIGAGNGGYLGQLFDITTATKVKSIFAYFTKGYTDRRFAALIWNTDPGTGKPTTIFAATDTLIYPNDDAIGVSIPMFGGIKDVPIGKYVVTAIEFDSTLALGLTQQIFTENKIFVNWPTIPGGGWQTVETFGNAFRRAFILRMNLFDNPPLPVKIISFTGSQKPGGNQLTWSVAEQSNIISFGVERSSDGRSFERLGLVKATTLLTDNYTYLDGYTAKGTVFYRLRVEEKGQTGYSRIVRLQNDKGPGQLSVWPNPVLSVVTIQGDAPGLLNTEARLTDINGKVYRHFVINQLPFQLDVDDLPDGIYIIQPLGKPALKFIKQ